MEPTLSVYVHWPFCLSRCPYCDFNAHVAHQNDLQAEYVAALIRELQWYQGYIGRRKITSVFFGGGTPSLLDPQSVAMVIDAITELHELPSHAEITLEANPTSAEINKFKGYRLAGVNRVSVGVQSLRQDDLSMLGRKHSVLEAKRAIIASQSVFERSSFDLIYARHRTHSVAAWSKELSEALDMAAGHLSLYALTLEPNTPFRRAADQGRLSVAGDDLKADLMKATFDLCSAQGYEWYEISNFARANQECLHNLTYWQSGEFLGVGPGAHSRINIGQRLEARAAIRSPRKWRTETEQQGHGTEIIEHLSDEQRAIEYILNGIRIRQGVSLSDLQQATSHIPAQDAIDQLHSAGVVQCDGQVIRLTNRGRFVADTVARELVVNLMPS